MNRLCNVLMKRVYRTLGLVLLVGLLFGQTSHFVAGQADDEWTAPLNISQSGTATKPYIVMDADQQLHVLWQDTLDGSFFYTKGKWYSLE